MTPHVDSSARLQRLIERLQPRFRRAFAEAVGTLRNERSLVEITRFLEVGRFDLALSSLEAAAARVASPWGETYYTSGRETARFVAGSLNVLLTFNVADPRALRIVEENSLRMVRAFSAEQFRATRAALSEGLRFGVNPRDTARLFRDSIGLTENQARAVVNYRRLLNEGSLDALNRKLRDRRFDPTVRGAFAEGRALTGEQVDRMVGRYGERMLAHRAEVIARTETLSAVHAGSDELYRQAVESGDLPADGLVQEWVPAGDARTRDWHASMAGQQRLLGEPFTSGRGNSLRFPGDPNAPANEVIQCRCAITTRFNDEAVQARRALLSSAVGA